MASIQSEKDEMTQKALYYVRIFGELLSNDGTFYITQLPVSEAIRPEQHRNLRRIFQHFQKGVDEDEQIVDEDKQRVVEDEQGMSEDEQGMDEDPPSTSPIAPTSHNEMASVVPEHRGGPPTTDVSEDTQLTSPLVPSGNEETASIAPNKRRRLSNTSIKASTKKGEDLDSDGDIIIRKKRGRPSNTSTNASVKRASIFTKSWGAILAVDEFKLDEALRTYLNTYPSTDVASFFKADLPELKKPDQHDLAKFLEFCQKVDKMPRRIDHRPSNVSRIDHVRRLFLWVTVGDLANHIFGVDWSNTKKRELKTTIANALEEDDRTALLKKLVLAAQVTFICRNLGMGALFWLPDQLTDYFLQKKVTRTGDSLQEMMRHVRSRGLPQSIQTSGANGLGTAIRAYLCSQYGIEEEKSVAVQLPEDLVDGSGSGSGEAGRGQDHGEDDVQA